MALKLRYFHLNGLAESIRYILHYGGQKFEDVRYDRKTWPIQSIKDSLPYGQLPLYEKDNKTLNQSVAIARYLAGQVKLLPSDPWDQAVLDAAVLSIYDFWHKVVAFVREADETRKEVIKKEIIDVHIDFYFSRYEKELKNNNGHFSGKLSWADFILVGILEAANLMLGTEIEKKYPHVLALAQKIRSLSGVKEYIATRKPYIV